MRPSRWRRRKGCAMYEYAAKVNRRKSSWAGQQQSMSSRYQLVWTLFPVVTSALCPAMRRATWCERLDLQGAGTGLLFPQRRLSKSEQ
eukprot:6203379-Pleurochrysis_carterae.AAC.2